jgi:hypothetical protein
MLAPPLIQVVSVQVTALTLSLRPPLLQRTLLRNCSAVTIPPTNPELRLQRATILVRIIPRFPMTFKTAWAGVTSASSGQG